jgi:hypothetical protein
MVKRAKPNKGLGENMVMVLFLVLLLTILFAFDSFTGNPDSIERQSQLLVGKLVIDSVQGNQPAVIVGDRLDLTKVQQLAAMDYLQLKELLGLHADFAMYFEDGEGNLVPIAGKNCIGSPYARVNGDRCS